VDITSQDSLAETLDLVNDAFFYDHAPTQAARKEAALWISGRYGKPGSYAGMFAPTANDFRHGTSAFTGEPIRSRVAIAHILGEEACRALLLLDVPDAAVKEALDGATHGMLQRLRQAETGNDVTGMYCCGTCSPAYWRHVAAGGLDRNEARLTAAMRILKSHRAGEGRWRRFPFFYTLLALAGMDSKPALEEMRYAAPAVERYLKRSPSKGKYSARRRTVCDRILARC